MSCKGALLREFPDRAVTLPLDKLRDAALLDVLVDAIIELEFNIAPGARPEASKAGKLHPEERDTLSPALATGLLTDVLVGLGQEVHPKRITKRSREQVCWNNALPFHRSATWLLIRVALRLVLDRRAALHGETSWYKALMAHHCTRILHVARSASHLSIPSDTLFSMEAKLVRRIIKLDPAGDVCSGWLRAAQETIRGVKATLDARWAAELRRDNQSLPLDKLSQLSFRQDSELKLTGLLSHLSWIESRQSGQRGGMGEGDVTQFRPLPPMELPSLGSCMHGSAVMERFELAEFEAWVESSLPGWLSSNRLSVEEAVSALKELIEAYSRRASAAYQGIPGALSIMYLVIGELWIALDKLAGREIPLLLDYDPGFPPDAFNPLLLERTEEMGRLHAAENYLSSRRARAPNSYPSAFRGFGCDDSFAVRFFRSSAAHQRLRRDIEAWGVRMEAEKLQEYERTRAEYDSLAEAYNATSCEYYWDYRWQEKKHSSGCERCRLERKMENVNINVFERPLPEDPSYADAAVFEISVPQLAVFWRDVTWKLVTEVFCEKGKDADLCEPGQETLYFAAGRQGMGRFLQAKSHLQPASTVKPMEVVHYRTKHILEATPENICIPHAARYTYYDEPTRVSAERVPLHACIPRRCSYAELVKGDAAEQWIRFTNHTSNDVIAEQHRCPLTVPLREFRSLGNLRSGVGLQWANILCQLVIPSLDFNKTRTLALVLQASLEAGPRPGSGVVGGGEHVGSVWREAHVDTQKESFMNRVLPSLHDALLRVRESWQNNIALCVLTCLATRLLALSPSAVMASALLDYLGQLREVSVTWARLLRDKLDRSDKALDRQRWIDRLLLAALTCGATFSMGAAHLGAVLNDPENLSKLVESAVLARNHLATSGRPADAVALQLVQRWHAVMYRARHLVAREVMERDNAGLDSAIKLLWADYSPSAAAGWVRVDRDAQGHILTRMSGGLVPVTFNLMTGNLFLNGYPLAKLPSSYQDHSTFQQLLGDQILDVGPSSVPGMEFSASRDVSGWVLHFATKDSRQVVRAVRQRSQGCGGGGGGVQDGSPLDDGYEYIPREHLTNDLPSSFVNEYAHWLHLATGRVEFRPLDRRWESVMGVGWCLAREDHKYILRKGSRVVMDPSSPTAQLSHLIILRAIETPGNINAILDCNDSSLALELPRLSLSFQVQQGKNTVRCINYSGMQVDEAQGVGSLVGLVNKLVLKSEHGTGFRLVLVPRGQASCHLVEASSHVRVSIHQGNNKRVRHDAFHVNDKLGCLVDAGSLQSKLYLCWLHALTSHCLPDPLTARTGTEEALRILQGAAVRSFPSLDRDSRALLAQIARLSPLRTYYPPHLQAMEQTLWSDALPPLSQHEDFWPLATRIFEDYKKSGMLFHPELWAADADDDDTPALSPDVLSEEGSPELAQRARIRNAIFRVSEFGAEGHTTTEDEWYLPRGRAAAGGPDSEPWVPQLVRCMDTGDERLVWTQEPGMARRIETVNGAKFSGNPTVEIAFRLNHLREPTRALGGLWCGLHRALVAETNKYRKMFFLSCLLYAEGPDPQVVQALMALGSISVFAQANMLPPPDDTFDLSIRHVTLRDELVRVAQDGTKYLWECPEYRWTKHSYESVREFDYRQKQACESNSWTAIAEFADELITQVGRSWTVHAPTSATCRSYLRVDQLMPRVLDLVETARKSHAFLNYLNSLARNLGRIATTTTMDRREPVLVSVRSSDRPSSRPGLVSAASLFSRPAPGVREPEQEHARLSALIDELLAVGNLQCHQVSYMAELRHSMASPATAQPATTAVTQDARSGDLQEAQKRYSSGFRSAELALAGTSIAHQVCLDAGAYPRISPMFLLQRLTRGFWTQLPAQWQGCLVDLALSLVYFQRAERLHDHCSRLPERRGDLQRELSNSGDHQNPEWDPLKYPENLLLEIEQGILIRPVQNKIAAAMRSPPEMKNAVMQLNMGEGKSSVIVPIVAAALADGERLVRVVVAKPQSNQMAHLLVAKLGGLLNRPVFYLPLSRSIQLTSHGVCVVSEIVQRCRVEGGVLLVQPEHLLSFKLMGIEKSWAAPARVGARHEKTDGGGALGDSIVGLYRHFESVSRDIVDESDENFSVKFELIYTMGAQEPVEMSPERWTLIQQLLDMTETVVRRLVAAAVEHETAHEVEVAEGIIFQDHHAGRVPLIRILGVPAGRHLIAELAATICQRGLRGFPVHNQNERMRQAVRNYISADPAAPESIALVEDADAGLFGSPDAKNALLLLRGLLAKGVILFALGQKRFRVNYGLAPGRRPQTMLAVPYRAKDMPSPRSEFSHPDVVIVLTCLSYYYSGLSDAQMYTCLELLGESDQAEQEFGRWAAQSPDLPPSFRHFSSINIEDKPQCERTVFPALRWTRPVVDFYLARVVFPKEMKQFPLKLSASGWDLARPKKHPLTGFSGTNDSKDVLPLSVRALDLQPHTNAVVLSTILRDENTVLEVRPEKGAAAAALSEEMLLGLLERSEPPIRVILDVGAQVIESSNAQMAKKLLQLASAPASSADAVIFFNDEDELSVLLRNGDVVPFLTSPFATRTDRCLVFLDQAHTRGTDLKLPDDYRAAVTLGPGVTKDTLVQACMRMRKLGRGQSVSFLVSPEMQNRIRAIRNVARDERPLSVADVIAWAISETWDEAVRSVPLWAVQGMRHIRQEAIWERVEGEGAQGVFSSADAQAYLEPEAICLESRYRPAPTAGRDSAEEAVALRMSNLDLGGDGAEPEQTTAQPCAQMSAIRAKLAAFTHATTTCASSSSSALQEEQERELAPEMEEEAHVSRPPPRKALPHKLDRRLVQFVRTGCAEIASAAFLPCFSVMLTTSAASLFPPGLAAFPSSLLATEDFARTVEETGPLYRSDSYQRDAQWVLVRSARATATQNETSLRSERMVLVSQWEASRLKGVIENMAAASEEAVPPVTLHAYLPRPSLTFPSMEHLKTYTIPAVPAGWEAPRDLVMELNLFACQLYLRSYDEYKSLCKYLGLAYTENKDPETAVPPDGFVGKRKYPECEFGSSPVAFLAKLYNGIRGDCVGGLEKTHMGKILAGEILTETDF